MSSRPPPWRVRVHPGDLRCIALAALFAALALGLDLLRLARGPTPTEVTLASLSHGFAFARTVACVALVPSGWRLAASPGDARALGALFALVLVADALILLAGMLVPGIAVFLVVQLGLALRHGAGLPRALRERPAGRGPVLARAAGVGLAWCVGMGLLWQPVRAAGLLGPVVVYSLALGLSLFAALSAVVAGHFGAVRGRACAWAMVLFVLCDITVATGAALAGTVAGRLADAATGIFYTPSLVLLALSAREELPR